jgi:hypothetical protein
MRNLGVDPLYEAASLSCPSVRHRYVPEWVVRLICPAAPRQHFGKLFAVLMPMHREVPVSPSNTLLLMKSPLAPKPSQANLANDTRKYNPLQKCINLVMFCVKTGRRQHLTPWSRVLEKLVKKVKKFFLLYGNGRLIPLLTRASQLSCTRWIQFTSSQHISLRSSLILFSHLRLGHPSNLFLSGYPTKTSMYLSSPTIRATFSAHLILDLNSWMTFGEE